MTHWRRLDSSKARGRVLIAVLVGAACVACAPAGGSREAATPEVRLTRWVDPFIGTADTGNTHPGATVPWGMVSVSPHTTIERDEGTSGRETLTRSAYVHGSPFVYGFTHTHISGCGCYAQGQVPLTPTTGEPAFTLDANRSEYSGQSASPGHYGVRLDRFGIEVEATATLRTGLTRFVFPEGRANLIVDARVRSSTVPGGMLRLEGPDTLVGRREEGAICSTNARNSVFFAIQLSRPADRWGLFAEESPVADETEIEGDAVGAFFSWDAAPEPLLARVGVSYVSIENAKLNLTTEQPRWDFEGVRAAAEATWEAALGRIRVEGGSDDERTLFYSALYRSLLLPSVASDVNGEYRAFVTNPERLLPKTPDYYSRPNVRSDTIEKADYLRRMNYSLWDTYRTTHPLLALAYPETQLDAVKTLVGMYEDAGALPLIEYGTAEIGVMVGDPSIPVIVDSWRKGIRGFDEDQAWEAILANARAPGEGGNAHRRGHDTWVEKGYIPEDRKAELGVWGTVSTGLEYAYADWTAAEMARDRGDAEWEARFRERAASWRQYWDPGTGFLRPRLDNGSWLEPFDTTTTAGEVPGFDHLGGPGYVEGNAWQYLFFVPHDIPGLAEAMGGWEAFAARLEETFENDHFVLWNEPDMAFPFLFNYAPGEEWRTQKWVRDSIERHFSVGPGGLPGNDDAGTLSSWLVFAMMGIYPDAPGSNLYQIASPVFDRVTIRPEAQGPEFSVVASREGPGDLYVQGMSLDGQPWTAYTLPHDAVARGGTLKVRMGPAPLRP